MIPRFFDERAYYEKKNCVDPNTRFWGSASVANARYAAILSHVDLSGKSVVDIGCGAGDFLSHLKREKKQPSKYVGLDVVPRFVEEAARNHPDAEFFVSDVASPDWAPRASEWCIANGLFGHSQESEAQWWERFSLITKRMWDSASRGMVVTLISTRSNKRNPAAHYIDPEAAIRFFIDNYGWKVLIDHSYLNNDFLLRVEK